MYKVSFDGLPDELLARLKECAPEIDRHPENVETSVRLVLKAGVGALPIPRDWGGGEFSLSDLVRALEELGAACPSTALCVAMHWLSVLYLSAWIDSVDNDAREPVLRAVRNEHAFVANCYGEPSGSIGSPATIAARHGDSWIVNGEKFGTFSAFSDFIQFHATVRGEDGDGRLIVFTIPRDTPGLQIKSGPASLEGVRGASPCIVYFNDCRILDRWRNGSVGAFSRAMLNYPFATLLLAAPYVGVAQNAIDTACRMALDRSMGGRTKLAALPHFKAGIADLTVQLEASRSLLYRAAAAAVCNPTNSARLLNDAAKASVARAAPSICLQAAQLAGFGGMSRDNDLQRHLRDAQALAHHPASLHAALAAVSQLTLDRIEQEALPMNADIFSSMRLPIKL